MNQYIGCHFLAPSVYRCHCPGAGTTNSHVPAHTVIWGYPEPVAYLQGLFHKWCGINKPLEHVVGDARDVVVIVIMRQTAGPGDRTRGPDRAAVGGFVEDHV